nr:uncharacterized protein LOC109193549 isoform X1 [Ipomoea trifida]
MPGNEVGDRVHNFFAQDTLSQGQHQSQVLDQNHPALNNNLWVGSQGPIGVPSYSTKSYNLQQSVVDTGRGSNSHLNGPHGLNFARSTLRSEIQLQSQQQSLNGYMYGNLYDTRQDEGSFLAADIGSDQRNVASLDSSFCEQSPQGVGPQHQAQPISSGVSESSGNFGLFGGQQQMSRQQSNMLQSLQLQQSGLKDMQQLQQQVMFMKMQELQRQQQLQQQDARHQNSLGQILPFPKVAPGSHSSPLVHNTIHSGALSFPWATDTSNTNWLQGSSSALQVSSNGFVSTNHGQGHHLMGLAPQQIDQSLFGVPVSTSRAGVSQYSQAVAEKPLIQQTVSFNNSFPFRQYAPPPDQIGVQDGAVTSRQRFVGESFFGHAPNQSLNNAINMENLQDVNAIQHGAAAQEFQARQEPAIPSVNTQEKTSKETASSNNEVGLDPTEERILFGSDDNIWAAFGKSPNMREEACNSLDGTGLDNGFPSIQGGTWSALMQSAVAEGSSADVGPQEEWSGLNFHSTVVPPGNQNISQYNSGRQPNSLIDVRMPIASSLNSETGQPSGSNNMKNTYVNLPGSQQLGHKFPNETGHSMQSNSVQRLVQPSEEGNKWPDVGPLQMSGAEGSRMLTNASLPLDTEIDAKRVPSSWMDEVGGPSKTCDRLSDWNGLGSAMPTEDASVNTHSSQNYSKYLGSSQNKGTHGEAVHTGALWKTDPGPSPAVDLELTRSPAGALVNSELLGMKSTDTIAKSSSMSGAEETSRFLSSRNQVKHWKNANTLFKGKESQGLERSQSHIIKDSHILNSLETTSQRGAKTNEIDTCDKQENSNDSYRSNVSHQNSAGSLRENVMLDPTDSRAVATGKEKSNQVGKKNSARKFQYHPMGNLDEDVDPPYGLQKPIHTQAMASQNAHFGHSKFLIQGQSSDVLRDGKVLADLHSQSCFPSSVSNMSAPLTRSLDIPPPVTASPSSPNMLQLLPKVDQSRVFGATMRQNALQIEMPKAESSDGSVGRLYPSQSPAAQVFGLQLGPPSQLTPVQNHILSSQSSMQTVCSSMSHSAVEFGEKAHVASMSQVKSFPPSSETTQGEFANRSGVPTNDNNENIRYEMHGKFSPAFNSGFPYSRSRIQNQQMATGQELKSQSTSNSFKDPPCFTEEDDTSNSSKNPPCFTEEDDSLREQSGGGLSAKNFSHEVAGNPNSLGTAKQTSIINSHETPQKSVDNSLPVSQHPSISGMSQQASLSKTMNNTWGTSQANPFGVLPSGEPSSISLLHQLNIVGTSSAPENRGDQDAIRGGNFSSEVCANSVNSSGKAPSEEQHLKESTSQQLSLRNIDSVQKVNKAQEEHIIKNLSDVYPVSSSSMQRDIEAFGRTLKPNNFSHQNYSLPNQVRAMKNVEIEQSNNNALKRSRVPDDGPGGQQMSHEAVPSVDSRMPNFTGPDHLERNIEGNVPTLDMHAIHRDDSQANALCNSASSVKFEHTQISPQMAPTWFSQYGNGTFKNGQVLAMHDAQRAASVKMGEPPLILGKPSSSLHIFNSKQQLIPANNDISQQAKPSMHPTPTAAEHFPSSQSLSVSISDQHLLLRPKKRRRVTADLSPWCKEVSLSLQSLQTISMGERDWAKAANRVTEKVEEDVDFNENCPSRVRARRRLILTTQLMQQLFRPPPMTILSANSSVEYEAVAYSASRLALGDACGVVSRPNSDQSMAAEGSELLSRKCTTSEDSDHQHFSKVVEEFTGRARKLEEEFLKLDKRVSLVDLIVENQDLEKFSVINRFAKFYGRGQADGADTSTSSDAAAHPYKAFAQRYVTAFPMPRNVPSGVQCFSL